MKDVVTLQKCVVNNILQNIFWESLLQLTADLQKLTVYLQSFSNFYSLSNKIIPSVVLAQSHNCGNGTE